MIVEEYLAKIEGERGNKIRAFHQEHLKLFKQAAGSGHNHQAWEGGYKEHLGQCLGIANDLYWKFRPYFERGAGFSLVEDKSKFPVTIEEIVVVIYFHDIEKMFKYSDNNNPPADSAFSKEHFFFNKEEFLRRTLPDRWGIKLTEAELDAIEYIHGEGLDYSKHKRVMSQLCAICHMADIGSARVLFDIGKPRKPTEPS
jgi:hypothetical protein